MKQRKRPSSSLRASLRDGDASAVMLGSGETYLGPLGIFLQATPLQLGILATVPTFIGALFQGLSVWVTERFRKRKLVILGSVIINALMLLAIALLCISEVQRSTKLQLLILFAALYHTALGFIAPPWSSLIGDLAPSTRRVKFFAIRNRRIGIFTFISTICAGQLLHLFTRQHYEALGFALIFLIAFFARLVSLRALSQHRDIPYHSSPEQRFRFIDFIKRAPYSNFALFVFFISLVHFGAAIAGPYFALYMLRDLKLSYSEFTLVTAMAVLSQFLTMRNWGRICYTFGSKRILTICGYSVAAVPILWLGGTGIPWLIAIQMFAGCMWAGFNLSAQNFLFDAVSPPKRARCAAYLAIVNGFFVMLGSLTGAALTFILPESVAFSAFTSDADSTLLVLFVVSAICRLVAARIFLPRFKEVRDVRDVSVRNLIFRIVNPRPFMGDAFSVISGGSRKRRKDLPVHKD